MFFILDLDKMSYTVSNTSTGKSNRQPDQLLHAIYPYNKRGIIYFMEDGVRGAAGIFAQDMNGRKFAILEGAAACQTKPQDLPYVTVKRR